jgi:TolA-binding protein
MTDFTAAEEAYASGKIKESAELYAKALPSMGTLAVVGHARAIRAFDAAGRYTDAIRSLMVVLDANPEVWVFDLKPTTLPDARSRNLTDAAGILAGKMADQRFKAAELQKEFRTLLLEIYTKAGNTEKATEMAKALGGAEATTPANTNTTPGTPDNTQTPAVTTSTVDAASVSAIEADVKAKRYDAVITKVDAMLAGASGDQAVRLYMAQAQSYAGLNKADLAVGSYIRIVAHYPALPQAPEALLSAVELLQKDKDKKDQAKRLADELKQRYPQSSAAKRLQG